MSLAIIFTGTTAANSLQPANDDLLLDLPKNVWIRGTTVTLIDDKRCWAKNDNPILYAKVNGLYIDQIHGWYKSIAKGKLVMPKKGCKKGNFYHVKYRFELKDGGNGKKLTLRSGYYGGLKGKFKRTVFSSIAQYNEAMKRFSDALKKVVSGDDSTPALTPLPAPAWSVTDSTTWSGQELEFMNYFRSSLLNKVNKWESDFTLDQEMGFSFTGYASCRVFTDPAAAYSNVYRYDRAANQGVELYGIERVRARLLVQRFYSDFCNENYGLKWI